MAPPIDRRDVDRLVVEHLPAALRMALRLAGNAHAAEDLVQETLLRVLRQWPKFRGDASFKTWMLGILVNADRDRRRRLRIHQPLDEGAAETPNESPPQLAAAVELDAAVRAAIEKLPDRQREVALLSWGEGLEPAETAAALNITEANVYTNLHLARRRIAAVLGVDAAGRDLK
jgi:RNA polymerase sigma-70 factor (ECF subfamily)